MLNPKFQRTQSTQSSLPKQDFPAAQNGRSSMPLLVEMLKTLKLNEIPGIAMKVKGILLTQNEQAASKMLRLLAQPYYSQQLAPDNFISFADNLTGEFLIGCTDDGKAFGLDRADLNRHVFIAGQSGSGKSNLNKLLFTQAQSKGLHLVHIDRKGDLTHTAREGIDVIHWEHDRLNPLCPPDTRVDIFEYRNDLVKAFCDFMQFLQRGMSIFLLGIDTLYREFNVYERWPVWDWSSMTFPTFIDLLELFKSREFMKIIRGQGTESLLSIIDKLASIVIQLEPIISCQRGFDIQRFHAEGRAVNCVVDGLTVEYQNFLVVIKLLGYYHHFKAHGPRNQLNTLFMFDEAKGLFGKTNENTFILKDLISKVREFGIGMICADQVPSEMSQFFLSNIGTLIAFRLADGNDLNKVRISSGESIQQALENYSLKPGEAIVRTMKCKDLIKVKIPFQPAEKFITREELDRLMAPRLEELNKDVILYKKAVSAENNGAHTDTQPDGGIALDNEERAFLTELAREFLKPAYKVYEESGLSNSVGFRLKKRLLAKKCISQVTTNLGKDGKQAIFLIPNPIICEQLGIQLPEGRGKAMHKQFQAKLKEQAEQLGYEAAIEQSTNGTSEAPDVNFAKSDKRIAVEICITSKPASEAENIGKNFRLGYSLVILSFVNRQVLEKTQELAKAKYSAEELKAVRFCLINQVMSAIEA